VDIEITWRGKPFTGASGERKANKFESEGVNIRARKPSEEGGGDGEDSLSRQRGQR
jgi:hypothetical protein